MKTSEIVGLIPLWANAAASDLVASPAWAMPCRLGDDSCVMRLDAIRPADTLDIAILLEDESHVLSLVDTPRFAELHRLWATRAEVPEPILLALIEKECAPLLQLVENAVRRQLKIAGLAREVPEGRLCARICDSAGNEVLAFALTASASLVRTLGRITFIDPDHPSVRETMLPAVTELAAFTLPAADVSALDVGDALLLPEVGTIAPRFIVDGRFAVDSNGVSPYRDDGMVLVLDAETREIPLGKVLDAAKSPSAPEAPAPVQLKLVAAGRTIACGRLARVAGQPALIVESIAPA